MVRFLLHKFSAETNVYLQTKLLKNEKEKHDYFKNCKEMG